jgi:hypothetical protein
MPNPVYKSDSVYHGKAAPQFSYIYDGDNQEWRPMTPADLAGLGESDLLKPPALSVYRNINLSGAISEVSNGATKLAGFFVDNNLNDEPLFVQFYSNPYTSESTPFITYPIYAQSTLDQSFSYLVHGFQGILVKISEDREGLYPWPGNNGTGLIANIYYRA